MTLPVSGSPSTQRRGDERLPDGAPPHTWWYGIQLESSWRRLEGKESGLRWFFSPYSKRKQKRFFWKRKAKVSCISFPFSPSLKENKSVQPNEISFLQSEQVANNKWWPLILVATVANWHFVWVFNTDWSGCVCVCFVNVVTDRCLPRPIKSTDDKCISNLPNNQLVWRSIQGWLNKFIAILNANSWHA